MLIERLLRTRLIVVGHRLIQDAEISSLLEIRGHPHNEPKWIIIEVAADIVVAPLRQRLVLMICSARRELRAARSRIRSLARLGAM